MKHDWNALKSEFISSKETINQFRKRKKIDKDLAYKRANGDGWLEARDRIQSNAVTRHETNVEDALVETYGAFLDIWEKAKGKLASLLEKEQISAKELRDAMGAADLIFKNERLLRGQSTQNVSKVNYHALIMRDLGLDPGAFKIRAEEIQDGQTVNE